MTRPSPTSSRSRSISSDGPTGAHWGSLAWRTLRVLCKGAAASLSVRPKLRRVCRFPLLTMNLKSARFHVPCLAPHLCVAVADGADAVLHHRDLCCCHAWLIRMNHASRMQAAERRLWTRRGSAVAPSGCAPTPRPPLHGRVTLCRPLARPRFVAPVVAFRQP